MGHPAVSASGRTQVQVGLEGSITRKENGHEWQTLMEYAGAPCDLVGGCARARPGSRRRGLVPPTNLSDWQDAMEVYRLEVGSDGTQAAFWPDLEVYTS